jgi:hypothetical protein
MEAGEERGGACAVEAMVVIEDAAVQRVGSFTLRGYDTW